jgi:cytochrome P450
MTPEQIAAAEEAIVLLLAYVDQLAARRNDHPGDDLMSALIAARDEGDRVTHEELVAMVANLLVGGHDTTSSQIGCSLLTLLRHPEQSQLLRENPALLAVAVEETIRFEPSIAAAPRAVTRPVTIAGCELEPHAFVALCTAAANRDAEVRDEPDRVDLTRFGRPGTPALLSFGAGPHFCLGAALTRMTLQETVRATILGAPSLRLAVDPARLPWRVVLGRSPAQLPVTVATVA